MVAGQANKIKKKCSLVFCRKEKRKKGPTDFINTLNMASVSFCYCFIYVTLLKYAVEAEVTYSKYLLMLHLLIVNK